MSTQTWTLDTAGMIYIDKNKIEHTITANETLQFDFGTITSGAAFTGVAGNGFLCTDGFRVALDADPIYEFRITMNGAPFGFSPGEICFVESDGTRHRFRIKGIALTVYDGVGANNVTSITLESRIHGLTMTWTNIDTA